MATYRPNTDIDALTAFLDERCVAGPAQVVPVSDLLAAWIAWAGEHDVWVRPKEFTSDLKKARPEIAMFRPARQPRHYRGIRLVDPS